MNTRTTTLLELDSHTLTTEVAKQDNLDTGSLLRLSLANTYAYQLFKPTLLQCLKKYIERSAEKQVQAILKIYPNFDSSRLRDICQTVLLSGDIVVFKAITKRRKDILKQIEFPKKLVDENNTYDFCAVVAAITSDKNVEEVLAQFRTDLDKIVKEKGYPFQALLDAYKIIDNNYDLWSFAQHQLFNVKVIGYLQRLSPAWLKKAFATGIHKIVEKGRVCGDTFILRSGESIDPARDVSNSGLGVDFCVNIVGDKSAGWYEKVVKRGWTWTYCYGIFVEKLFRAKTAQHAKLMPLTVFGLKLF